MPQDRETAKAPDLDEFDFDALATKLLDGRMITFLGAGASLDAPLVDEGAPLHPTPEPGMENNLPEAPQVSENTPSLLTPEPGTADDLPGVPPVAEDTPRLPTGAMLATGLLEDLNDTRAHGHPWNGNLALIAQYCANERTEYWLNGQLRSKFLAQYRPVEIHEALASIVPRQKRHNKPLRAPLILTTNYDSLIEAALDKHSKSDGIDYDTMVYSVHPDPTAASASFYFRRSNAPNSFEWITDPSQFGGIERSGALGSYLAARPLVVKIHGSVHTHDAALDSFVITQDHYIRYLVRMDPSTFLPDSVAAILPNHPYLFLGYSLSDWNIAALLDYFWTKRRMSIPSFAVTWKPSPVDQKFWNHKKIQPYDGSVPVGKTFGRRLLDALEDLAPLKQ